MKKPEIPNIRKRVNPSGAVTYFIDYWDPQKGKRIREIVGTRKSDAQKRSSYVYNQMKKHWLGEDDRPVTDLNIQDLVDIFIQSKRGRTKDRTVSRYNIHARHFVDFMRINFPSVRYIGLVNRTYIEAHLDALRQGGQQPKTLNAQLRFIQSLFIFAIAEGYCRTNPAKGIDRYHEPQRAEEVKHWSKGEMEQILNKVDVRYRDAFEFIYNTGLRKEELMYLTWDDVAIDNSEPVIKIQAKEYAPGKHWDPKAKQRRIIPLNRRGVKLIRRQPRTGSSNWVFRAPNGGQLHPDRLLRTLKVALDELGLEGTVHKLRHTFASHLVMAGVGLETVSKLLGHSSIEMTMKYAHLAPEHLRNAVNQLVELEPVNQVDSSE